MAPAISSAKIVSDGLWSYSSAISDLPQLNPKNHIVYTDFSQKPNNNNLERKWSDFKTLQPRFRGFKSLLGLWAFLTNQIYYHNYFKPNSKLNGLTPAEPIRTSLPPFKSKWKLLTHYLS